MGGFRPGTAIPEKIGVYKSTGEGISWAPTGADFQVVKDQALSPEYANDGILFAGSSFGVWKSIDSGSLARFSSSACCRWGPIILVKRRRTSSAMN